MGADKEADEEKYDTKIKLDLDAERTAVKERCEQLIQPKKEGGRKVKKMKCQTFFISLNYANFTFLN
jgi:hypothetical protein